MKKHSCHRCSGETNLPTASHFTDEQLCPECSAEEFDLRKDLKYAGFNPRQMFNLGYIPAHMVAALKNDEGPIVEIDRSEK